MTTTGEHFTDQAASFAAILDGAAGQWDAPTPCAGWSVRDVVAHIIETQRDFLEQHDLAPTVTSDLSDPSTAWREHSTAVAETLSRDGVAEREYDGYFGRTTIGATMTAFYGWDLVIHGSDIARATDQPWEVSEAEAARLHTTADGWGDALYSEGICAAAVAVGAIASPTERLLARLGRDPQWSPVTSARE